MRAHDKKYLESPKGELPTEVFEALFPELSESDRALFQLMMPLGKKLELLNSDELDRGRHQARRTRVHLEEVHPFAAENELDEDELYNRVDPKARKIIESMPGLAEMEPKRRRVTAGVIWWAEYYEQKYTLEFEAENRDWEHKKKLEALEKNASSLSRMP